LNYKELLKTHIMKIEITNQGKWYNSLTLKIALLAVLGLFLLIPLQMIKEIIEDRQANAEKVQEEISGEWANSQCLTGPVINIPIRTVSAEDKTRTVTQIWHILPEEIIIDGDILPEIRSRRIYKTAVYNANLKISGTFAIPVESALPVAEILWNQAYYTVGISDNRGLKGEIEMHAGARALRAEPGVKDQDVFNSGFSFAETELKPGSTVAFDLSITLAGSTSLSVTPLGKNTHASLRSAWDSPGFYGSFLPLSRVVDKSGFTADWEVTHLNRNFPQSWTGNAFQPEESAFGVNLVQPVDHYQKSWRSARYGILFIALTFLVLLFIEIRGKKTIPVIHYVLVSLALILFFSLLTALSEQLGFNAAYLAASGATIVLIAVFTALVIKDKKTPWLVFGLLVLLYAFIYVLLTLNDYAFLAGNIGLFLILAVVMGVVGRWNLLRQLTGPNLLSN
jgi:inner membrane protein